MRALRRIAFAVTILAIFFGAVLMLADPRHRIGGAAAAGDVVAPERLTPAAMNGKVAFDQFCASCHGENGAGTEKGPPLIHRIYEPGHHGDASFVLAARNGVRSHHWRFGDMPPVEGVSDAQLGWIVTYVREVQRANGIE